MCSKKTGTRLSEIVGYTEPRLHEGKKWYVDFYALDPITKELRRKKYHIDSITSIRARRAKAAQIIAMLSEKLRNGWSPWMKSHDERIFTPLNEIFERYRKHLEKYDRAKTRYGYSSRLGVLESYLQTLTKPILYAYQLDTGVLNDFLDWLYLDKGVSGRTRNNYRGWLSSFCEFLVTRKYISENPVSNIPSVRQSPSKKEDITPLMLRQLQEYLTETDKYFLFACMFHYYTLIRPQEMSHIHIEDIEVKEQRVFIPAEVSKNRRDGYVALNDDLIKMMLDLKIFDSPSGFYLFGSSFRPSPKRAGADVFNKRWAKVRAALGWSKNVLFYSLKSAGIRDLANSEGIVVARDQARHSDISTTNKYLIGRGVKVAEAPKHFKGGFSDKS